MAVTPEEQAMIVSQDAWGRIVALLAAADGDIAGAEEALAAALEKAVRTWPVDGVPDNPQGWLYRVARNARRDVWKSAAARTSVAFSPELHDRPSLAEAADGVDVDAVPDRRLELLAACAHPQIDPPTRPLLMLSAVLGMTGAQIAAAMALPAATVSARLTRAKKRIAASSIGFELPDRSSMPARLEAILEAIYGAFAIEWVHAAAEPRAGTTGEALFLSRLVAELCPDDAESHGLAALLHLSASRFPARRDAAGAFVPLAEQDPDRWDASLVARGEHHLRNVHLCRPVGRFGLEAAIQIVHMSGIRRGRTDWPVLLRLHNDLEAMAPTLGGAVARSAVIAEISGPDAGLRALDHAGDTARIAGYQPAWTLRADLLRRSGRNAEAREAVARAISLTTDPAERDHLTGIAHRLGDD